MTTQTQVADFQVSIIVDEDISWFEVPVHNPLAMHVLQCASDLMDVSPDLFLRKADFVLRRSLHNHLEVAFLCPLDSNEQLVQLVVDEPAQILHNVRMI